jgi:hypothetical protein
LRFASYNQNNIMILEAGGNVGIGTTSPSNQFHVDTADNPTSTFLASITSRGGSNSNNALFLKGGASSDSNSILQAVSRSGSVLFDVGGAGKVEVAKFTSGTNTVQEVLTLTHFDEGAAGNNNIGTSIGFYAEDDSGYTEKIGRIDVNYTDATHPSHTSRIDIVAGPESVELGLSILSSGNVGIGTTAPNHDLEIGTGTYSEIDAGESTFTTGSSRTFKQNIKNVTLNQSILRQISKIPVITYDFKPEICNVSDYDGKCTNKIGLIAEDFHQIFKRGDKKSLSGDEVKMALWLAVQELKLEKDAEIQELKLENTQMKQLICLDHPEAEICQ